MGNENFEASEITRKEFRSNRSAESEQMFDYAESVAAEKAAAEQAAVQAKENAVSQLTELNSKIAGFKAQLDLMSKNAEKNADIIGIIQKELDGAQAEYDKVRNQARGA